MEWRLTQEPLTEIAIDAVVVFHAENRMNTQGFTRVIDELLEFRISQLISCGEITGAYGEITVIHLFGQIPAERVIVLGLGKEERIDLKRLKQVIGLGIQRVEEMKLRQIAIGSPLPFLEQFQTVDWIQAIVEGAELAAYIPPKISNQQMDKHLHTIWLSALDYSLTVIDRGLMRGRILANATNFARYLTDQPANWMTPDILEKKAIEIAEKNGLGIEVLEYQDLKRLGMNALLTVGKGSQYPPRMIVLNYQGSPRRKETYALIGKGVTFDSGGLQIKKDLEMYGMKRDMAGAAAVLAVMDAISKIGSYKNVIAVLPVCENVIDANAMRPDDVIQTFSGKTVEISHTDSEGRLILADAISYAISLGATKIIDIATLTGAIIVALGTEATGLMTNDMHWGLQVKRAARAAGERTWELPLFEEYEEFLESDIADLKNDDGSEAGAIQAGMFLKQFAEDVPWVHLDIAGTAENRKQKGAMRKGATGVGVRTLLQLLINEVEE